MIDFNFIIVSCLGLLVLEIPDGTGPSLDVKVYETGLGTSLLSNTL